MNKKLCCKNCRNRVLFILGCTSNLEFKVTTLKWPFYDYIYFILAMFDYGINQRDKNKPNIQKKAKQLVENCKFITKI